MPPTASTNELVASELVTWFETWFPKAYRLAESVSLAVQVWPELLRRARVELNRGEEVGSEADLWFSPLVESASPDGIVLRADVVAVLRQRLGKEPQRLDAAWRLLQEFHPFAPPVVVLEETLTWLALRVERMEELKEPAREQARVRRKMDLLLSQALHTLRTNTEREFDLARWAHHALPRLPKKARESEVWRDLAIAALIRVGGSWTPSHDEPPNRLPHRPSQVLPEGTGRTRLRLYRERGGLVFLDPEGEVPGYDLEVPATDPVVLELQWSEGEQEVWKLTFPEPGLRELVPESVGLIRLRALDGQRWNFFTAEEKPAGPPPVFISYARSSSLIQAQALLLALREERAFLDASSLGTGDSFPRVLAEALLASRVVVIFASEEYFRSWYCLWELETVLAPFLALGPEATEQQKEEALAPIVIAMPPTMVAMADVSSLPARLWTRPWPSMENTAELAKLVRERLVSGPKTLGERLEAAGQVGAELRSRLLEEGALPPPGNLANIRHYPHALPPSLGHSFVGRTDDLWRLHYTLSMQRGPHGGGVARAALTGALLGAGGFGKTQLALEYLHRFGPKHYPGGLFWVNADVSPERLEEQFHGILRTLWPEVPDLVTFRESHRNAARELAEVLERVTARAPVLYVVDNVPEPEPGERPKPLETWCPALGRVTLLVTSRARLDLGTEGIHGLLISTLATDAAVALLTAGIDPKALEEPDWYRIAEWVGYLPLALALLNRTLRTTVIQPRELLNRFQREGPTRELDAQLESLRPLVPAGALRGVAETFSLSYERLSASAQTAARLIAWMAPEPIPQPLANALGPEVASSEVRAVLLSRNFVTSAEASPVPMFGRMHPVMADYLRSRSTAPRVELKRVCQGLIEVMNMSEIREPSAWPLMDACRPHAESVFARLLKTDANSDVEAVLSLGLRLGLFLSAKGLAKQAQQILEQVLESATRELGTEHPYTLAAMTNLAETLLSQGDLRGARVYQERVLVANRRVQGDEHPDTLRAMSNLALTLLQMSDHREARVLLERVLAVSQRVLGEEHPDTLRAMGNLAETLLSQGDLRGARVYQERVLAVDQRVLGEEHPETLSAMDNLARVLQGQGAIPKARVLAERVLETRRRVLGELHPDTLMAMNNLAQTLYAQGEYGRARELFERVWEVSRRVLGEEHPDTLTVMNNLASTLSAQGEHGRARELFEKVGEVSRRVLGEEHPATLRAMNNLAQTLSAQGEYGRARESLQRVLEVSQRVLGGEHPDTLSAMDNLAHVLQEQGDLPRARELFARVLEGRRRALGEGHPLTRQSQELLDQLTGAKPRG